MECSADIMRLTHIASSTATKSKSRSNAHLIDQTRPQMFISGEIHGNERIVSIRICINISISIFMYHININIRVVDILCSVDGV